jgi:hypothetical protein
VRLLLAAGLLALLSGCQFAVVRYHGNGANAVVKECHVASDNPNALECWDYFEQRLARRGPIREL